MEDSHTVTRNKPVDFDSKLLALIHASKPKKEIDGVIAKMKSKWNYSGVYFKNYFRVNHSIQLNQLGFFGPYDEKQAEYVVHVQIFAPKKKSQIYPESNSTKVGEIQDKVCGKRQEIFYVPFPEPVVIKPGIWYLIDFRLDGPSTLRCLDTLSTVSVSVNDVMIKFEFGSGSMQMPCMKFRLLH